MADRSQINGAGHNRSAMSGRFISKAAASRWPGKTGVSRNDSQARDRIAPASMPVPEVSFPAGAQTGSDPVTAGQRAAAARIRVAYDKKRGQKTEPWIQRLAG